MSLRKYEETKGDKEKYINQDLRRNETQDKAGYVVYQGIGVD